jgi:hypothetical protein
LIDEVRWMRTAGGQITAVDNKVRRNLPQVGENRLERSAIAMNIRYYGHSHWSPTLLRLGFGSQHRRF